MGGQQIVQVGAAGSIPSSNNYGSLNFLLAYFGKTFRRFNDVQAAAEIVE